MKTTRFQGWWTPPGEGPRPARKPVPQGTVLETSIMSPHHDTTKTHRPTRKSSHALARRIRTGHDSRAARAAAAAGAPRVEPLESRTLLSTYYVSPAGSDTSAGTSDAAAFKT